MKNTFSSLLATLVLYISSASNPVLGATHSDAPIEFIGVYRINGQTGFSIRDKSSGRSTWIAKEIPVFGGVIDDYDPATQKIRFIANGEVFDIRLMEASHVNAQLTISTANNLILTGSNFDHSYTSLHGSKRLPAFIKTKDLDYQAILNLERSGYKIPAKDKQAAINRATQQQTIDLSKRFSNNQQEGHKTGPRLPFKTTSLKREEKIERKRFGHVE